MERFGNVESLDNNVNDSEIQRPIEGDEDKLERLDEYEGLNDSQRDRLGKLNEGKDNLVGFYGDQLDRIENDDSSTGDKLNCLKNMKNEAENFKDYYDNEKQNIIDNPDDDPQKKLVLKR